MKLTWELDAPRAHALARLVDGLDHETLRRYSTSDQELYDMVAVIESLRIAVKRLVGPQGDDDTRGG